MFGFNTNIMYQLRSFSDFNSLRKNQLLAFYDTLVSMISREKLMSALRTNKFRDYYFMPQFEVILCLSSRLVSTPG